MKIKKKRTFRHKSNNDKFSYNPSHHYMSNEKKPTKIAALALYLLIIITVFLGIISLLSKFFDINLF